MYMSVNIQTPQYYIINRGLWAQIEGGLRRMVKQIKPSALWIFSGLYRNPKNKSHFTLWLTFARDHEDKFFTIFPEKIQNHESGFNG